MKARSCGMFVHTGEELLVCQDELLPEMGRPAVISGKLTSFVISDETRIRPKNKLASETSLVLGQEDGRLLTI